MFGKLRSVPHLFAVVHGIAEMRPSIGRKWLEEGESWISRVDQVEDEPA